MVAPAVVGVDVGPGVHTVVFAYGGYGCYTALFVLAIAVFVALAVGPLALCGGGSGGTHYRLDDPTRKRGCRADSAATSNGLRQRLPPRAH